MTDERVIKAKIDSQGRVLIPAAVREAMNLAPGEPVTMRLDEDGLHLISSHLAMARLRRRVRKCVPRDVSLVDELIADRRAEAAREEQE